MVGVQNSALTPGYALAKSRPSSEIASLELKMDIFILIKGYGVSVGISKVCKPDSNQTVNLLLSSVMCLDMGELSKKATSSRASIFSVVIGLSSGIGLKRSTGRVIGTGVGVAEGAIVAVGESAITVDDGSEAVAVFDGVGAQLPIKTAMSINNANLFFISIRFHFFCEVFCKRNYSAITGCLNTVFILSGDAFRGSLK